MLEAGDHRYLSGQRHGGNLETAAAIAGCDPSEILDYSASLNPLGPPLSVLEAIASATGAIAHYPDPESRRLRSAVAQFYSLDPNWIVAGNGAADLLTWAARDCARLDGPTVVVTPAFSDYGRALRAANATWTTISCWDVDCSQPLPLDPQLQHLWTTPQPPKSLILNTPHNPTGQHWTLEQLVSWLPHFELVVVDEAFIDFIHDSTSASATHLVQEFPQVVVLRSLTKFFTIPGLRVGFAVGHPDRLTRWQQWRDPWAVNGLASVAAIAALSDIEFQTKSHRWLAPARQAFFTSINQVPGFQAFPSTANFLLARAPRSASDLQATLLRHDRILIRDCLSFNTLNNRYFRVAIRTPENNRKVTAALTQFASA